FADSAGALEARFAQVMAAGGDLDLVEALRARPLADQVDHAARRHGAVQGRGRPTKYLDLFHRLEIDLRLQVPVVIEQLQAVVVVLEIVEAADVEHIHAGGGAAAQLRRHSRYVPQR